MARWSGKPAITAANLAPGDKLPVADVSAAVGSQDATITVEELQAALGGTQQLGVTQSSHGLSVGDVARHDGSEWVESLADTSGHAVFGGLVVSAPDADTFLLASSGFVSGLSGLTAGSVYYLQDAGGLGTSPGTVTLAVLLATSTTTGVIITASSPAATPSTTWGSITGTLSAQTDLAAALTQSFVIACSDETTDLTTGTAKVTFRMPYAFTLSEVRASVNTAPTGDTIIVDINEGGTTILSTKLSIDASEKTSESAAAPAVISDSSLADDAEITIDIDQVGSSVAGKGLKVTLIGTPA